MVHARRFLPLIALVAIQASAETAIKSVNEQGDVTFSDKPTSDAVKEEKVIIDAPTPSPEGQQQAQQRAADLQKAAGQASQPAAASQKMPDTQSVEAAEKQLEEATEVREGDRIGTAGGGSRLTPEYHERVQEAEKAVERAKE